MIPILYACLCLFCHLDFPSPNPGFGVDISNGLVSFRFDARDRSFNRGGIADVSCHLILSYAILQYILALELFSVALASN